MYNSFYSNKLLIDLKTFDRHLRECALGSTMKTEQIQTDLFELDKLQNRIQLCSCFPSSNYRIGFEVEKELRDLQVSIPLSDEKVKNKLNSPHVHNTRWGNGRDTLFRKYG